MKTSHELIIAAFFAATVLITLRDQPGGTFLQQESGGTANTPPPSAIAAEIFTARSRSFDIIPFKGKTFGADVYWFNPKNAVYEEQIVDEIRSALERHLVLVFHNVSQHLSPVLHLRLAKMLGPVDPKVSGPPSYLWQGKFNSPDQVKRALQAGADKASLGKSMLNAAVNSKLPGEITRVVKEAGDLIAFGEGWHSDLTYRQAPPFIAVLVSRELPESGGNTMFSDMRAAYSSLPEQVRDEILTLEANHTDGRDKWAAHPVVRRDSRFGKSSLFVNKAFTRHLIAGGSKGGLLDRLLDHVDKMPVNQPNAVLDITWKQGQMVMWDNRYTQHAAQSDYTTRRELHRILVSGTVPF